MRAELIGATHVHMNTHVCMCIYIDIYIYTCRFECLGTLIHGGIHPNGGIPPCGVILPCEVYTWGLDPDMGVFPSSGGIPPHWGLHPCGGLPPHRGIHSNWGIPLMRGLCVPPTWRVYPHIEVSPMVLVDLGVYPHVGGEFRIWDGSGIFPDRGDGGGGCDGGGGGVELAGWGYTLLPPNGGDTPHGVHPP